MNIKKKDLAEVMLSNQIEEHKVKKTIEDIEAAIQAAKEERQAEKKEYRHVGLVLSGGDYEELPLVERPVFVLKIEADDDHNELAGRIRQVCKVHNSGKRTGKDPIFTISDVFSKAAKKITREEKVHFVGDSPLLLIEVENTVLETAEAPSFVQ